MEYYDDNWTAEALAELGYKEQGDVELVVAILKFSQLLLKHCGNRSIYLSSSRVNDLLNSACLNLVHAALEVGLELALRYHVSVKRVAAPNRHLASALLANHYNIELDRVTLLAQPFVKTPVTPVARFPDIPPATPSASACKTKDKTSNAAHKNVASMYANDLVALVAPDAADESTWSGWGDLKILYYPKTETTKDSTQETPAGDRTSSSIPRTPTPLRRSSTSVSQTPRSGRPEDSPSNRHHGGSADDHAMSGPKSFEIRQTTLKSTSVYDLLKTCPEDMPRNARYEFLNRLRICKALLGSSEDRQLALAVRLTAITNLMYIYSEATFVEKVLKQDNDEPRRFQLVYQLAELIHPSADGAADTPLWLQAIAFTALQGMVAIHSKYSDLISALNANVNHGVLMYVIRKAVASMKDDPSDEDDGKMTVADRWRTSLLRLTEHMVLSSRIGQEMTASGLLEVMIEILKLRSKTAERNWHIVLNFLDQFVYTYTGALTAFSNATGLDAIADLIIHTVNSSKELAQAGKGTQPQFHAHLVDYEVPFYHQQAIRYLLKFIHHIMASPLSFGTNTDRLLRNLVDNSALLHSLRVIIEETRLFGSLVWTNSATLLNDFINNDPTSFAAINESGMVQSFLTTLTGEEVAVPKPEENPRSGSNHGEDASSPDYSDDSVILESDDRQHPPTSEMMSAPRTRPLAHGIIAATEAINIIPSVLNAFSLNNAGLKMVVSSHSLDSFLEVFESPEHVHVMTRADLELANNLGVSFDELARHHPQLRPTISNAILDIAAKVVHLAKTKAKTEGWGARLLVNDPSGNPVAADESLLARTWVAPSVFKGKAKATAGDADVEMADAAPLVTQSSDVSPKMESDKSLDVHKDISPYILALCSFLSTLFGSNSTLKSSFIKGGGVELLLDLSEAPSLPQNFDLLQASRTLSQVLAQLVEASPVLGLPSLLNRIHDTVEDLQPLVARDQVYPLFAPFVVPGMSLVTEDGEWDSVLVRKVSSGTKLLRALIRLQSLVRAVYQSFPYSSRHQTVTVPGVNVYDLFVSLVKKLGPLLRDVIMESLSLSTLVPQGWSREKPLRDELEQIISPASANVNNDHPQAPEPVSGSTEQLLVLPGPKTDSNETKGNFNPTEEEKQTVQFKNFQAIHSLLNTMMPGILPFFQTLGKALLPRRIDSYVRSQHLDIGEALADTILEQLKLSQNQSTAKEFHHWAMMFHMLHEMLVDMTRMSERSGPHIILPVLVAFKEHGGIEVLNNMLQKFADDICTHDSEDLKNRQATIGMKKILEIYHFIVNGKNVVDSWGQVNLVQKSADSRSRDLSHQLVIELRMAILPVVRKLWVSELAEKAKTPILTRIIEILQTIAAADHEQNAYRKSDKTSSHPIFKNRERVRFSWVPHMALLKQLCDSGNDRNLSLEAIYRANGKPEDAEAYCRAHKSSDDTHLAGRRNSIPEYDEFKDPASPKSEPASLNSSSGPPADPMALDIQDAIGHAVLGDDLAEHSSEDLNDTSNEISSQDSASREASTAPVPPPTQQAASSSSTALDSSATSPVTKEDIDKERAELSSDLIDRCLDVLRAHPDSVFEISDLIQNMILKTNNEDKRTEVGEVLANALMSFAMDDESTKKTNGRSIAAYAHLLSLLLQDRPFFRSTLDSLKQNIGEYLGFLKVAPASSNEDLPPWMPYILLVFEILLMDDEQLVEAKWKIPTNEADEVEQPVWVAKELIMSEEDRSALLAAILDILPRIGKEESLALSVLRIMVVLTRDHAVAKTVGEKRNLQRLFVMAKQLCAGGSATMNKPHISDNIMIILRHIVEDEDIIRQVIETEIRQCLATPQRNSRGGFEIGTYLRQLSHVALRAPKLFVEATTRLVKLTRWVQPPPGDTASRSHHYILALKPAATLEDKATPKDSSVEPAVQATEDLTISDVKPSTESADKEMADVPKTPFEVKRPVLENPDGVVHFLLCELLNYREVDDKELPNQTSKEHDKTPAKEASAAGDTSGTDLEATPAPPDLSEELEGDSKKWDKKTSKSTFKAEEHPIFIYRCFLLNCLAELLQSFTRAKVEFINFKRSAPIQTNTPIKPRSSVLNYLLNDLICFGSSNSSVDPLISRKKLATASQASSVLVALVARTGEKPIERTRNNFEYDDEPDLLFVRRFVLDTVLRAYKEASTPGEPFDIRYPRMVSLAELMSQMLGEKDKESLPSNTRGTDAAVLRSQLQLRRLMYEKGYLAALTASIADVDLTFPDVKRTIKYILRVLRILARTAFQLSQADILQGTPADQPDDDLVSASSLSEIDDEREETPDLYRNSTLGMLEPGREDDYDSEEEEDDEEMYDEEVYEDELDYGDEMSQDEEDNPSDEDEEELGEMGHIEGLPGEPGVVEVIMGEDDDEDDDMDEDDEDESSDDEEEEEDMGSEDIEDIEDRIEIAAEESNAMGDDDDWESATDEEDEEDEEELDYEAEAQDLHEAQAHGHNLDPISHLLDLAREGIDPDDLDGEEIEDFDEHYPDEVPEDEGMIVTFNLEFMGI